MYNTYIKNIILGINCSWRAESRQENSILSHINLIWCAKQLKNDISRSKN